MQINDEEAQAIREYLKKNLFLQGLLDAWVECPYCSATVYASPFLPLASHEEAEQEIVHNPDCQYETLKQLLAKLKENHAKQDHNDSFC